MAEGTSLADLGDARGCSTNTFVIQSLINSFIHPLVKLDGVGPVDNRPSTD